MLFRSPPVRESHRAHQLGEVATERSDGRPTFVIRVHRHHEKDRVAVSGTTTAWGTTGDGFGLSILGICAWLDASEDLSKGPFGQVDADGKCSFPVEGGEWQPPAKSLS